MADDPITIDERLLARFVPMSALGPTHLKELSNHAELVSLAPGDTLSDDLTSAESTYYVVDGALSFTGGGLADEIVKASDPGSRFALPGAETLGRHARAVNHTHLLRVDRAKISTMLIWAQAAVSSGGDADGSKLRADITALLLQSRLFERVPPSNIERIGELIEPVQMRAGETVVRQGDTGDSYYIIERGRCEVLRETDAGGGSVRLAELGEGESFGEEALLTDSRRNATVRMLSDGVVLRLTRDYFIDLISEPLLQEVSHDRAEDLVGIGARWIDVRLREEFERDGLEGAVNIPLGELRARIRELKRGASYVTYCNAGRRAQAAAFLLCQRGIHACSLRGGISHKRPAGRGSRRPHKSLPDLHAALVRADAELDRALQRKAEADAAHEVEARLAERSATQSNAENYLKQLTARAQTAEQVLRAAMERKRELETRVRDAEADAASRRRAAEEECMHMRQMAQERLEAEKRGLENHYREASERLKRIDDARREAEAHFEAERQRIQRDLEQARARMEAEAARIRASMDRARREAEGKAEAIRREHASEEHKLRRQTEDALRAERVRLEDEFTNSITAQEKARHLLDQAEAARKEAERQTLELRARAQAELSARRRLEDQHREAEVQALREKSATAKARLEAAQRARAAAEARHKKVSVAYGELDAKGDDLQKATLEQELDGFRRELDTADDALNKARAEHASAAHAQAVAEETATVARTRAGELRLQLYEEMEGWIAEEEERSREDLDRSSHYAQQLERIQAEKSARREAAEQATASMFSEIESLLSGDSNDTIAQAGRSHLVAEEKARLVQRARREAAKQTAQARAAVSGKQDEGDKGS